MYVSLDKIKIAYKMPITYFDAGVTLTPFQDLLDWIDKHKDKPFFNNSAYPRGTNMLYELGSFAFNNNAILWEFNPNRIQFNDRFLETELIKLNNIHEWHDYQDNKHFTRIDIALDLDININAYYWFYEGTSYKDTIENKNDIETIYLGSRQSDTMIRIYNKEKECIAKDTLLPHHMENYEYKTRIELEWKKDTTPTLKDINECFKRLKIIPKDTNLDKILELTEIKTALELAYIIQNNRFDLLQELPRRQKEKLNEILKKIDVSWKYINLLEKLNFNDIIERVQRFYTSLNLFDLYDLPF